MLQEETPRPLEYHVAVIRRETFELWGQSTGETSAVRRSLGDVLWVQLQELADLGRSRIRKIVRFEKLLELRIRSSTTDEM